MMDIEAQERIETPRLILRPPALEDYDDYARMMSDPEMFVLAGGQPLTAEDAWIRLQRAAGHWRFHPYGLFSVIEKAGGRYVGETGIAHFMRGFGPGFDPYPETAWFFIQDVHGQGHASEAAKAAHDWFDRRSARRRLVCCVSVANVPSLKLAEKLGYRSFGEIRYRNADCLLLERPA